MKNQVLPLLCGATLVCGVMAVSAPAQQGGPRPPAAKPAQAGPDLTILHAQVILDHLGFSPGVIDGKRGQTLKQALSGFQAANGLKVSGELDRPTMAALARYKATRPLRVVTISAEDAKGPFVGPLPKDYAKQAKLPTLGYADLGEKLAEQYHTTRAVLAALNGGPRTKVGAGVTIKVPNVVTAQRRYPADLKPDWTATLAMLNVPANQPAADHIVVDKSEGVLKVYAAGDRLVAQFPVTTGSEHDPLPLGRWKINGPSYNPPFHFNPDLFWDAKSKDKEQLLPPGPNGPVGVIWLDLSKEHYGIHGTPNPETIGRSESHGCIRMTNWDAAKLSLMVKPGTPAIFQA